MPPTTRNRGVSSKPQKPAKNIPIKSNTSKITPDELANKLASGLNITESKGKQSVTALTTEQRRIAAMRSVNSASQHMSSLVQSGWKRPTQKRKEQSDTNLANATASSNSAVNGLEELRKICPGDLDVERAASSVVTKLLAIEMVCALLLDL